MTLGRSNKALEGMAGPRQRLAAIDVETGTSNPAV